MHGRGLVLLASAATCAGCSSEPPAPVEARRTPTRIQFVDASERLGLDTRAAMGVSLVDFDDDGTADVTLADVEAGIRLLRGSPGGLQAVTLPELDTRGARAVVWADVEDDGDLDLLVTRRGDQPMTPRLFRRDGGGFVDGTAAAGLDRPGHYEGAAFGDLDGDGVLDLILATSVTSLDGVPGFRGAPDLFLRNDGAGRFGDLAVGCVGPAHGEGWGVGIADLNADGQLDYVIGNDFRPSTVCLSGGQGALQDRSLVVPTGLGLMGLAWGDAHGDGCLDLYGTQVGRDVLVRANEVGALLNGWPAAIGPGPDPSAVVSGYGVTFLDADHDGDQDLAWGAAFEPLDVGVLPGGAAVLDNLGGGAYADVSLEQPCCFGAMGHVYGLAHGDVDGDGRADLLLGTSATAPFDTGPTPLEDVVFSGRPTLLLNRSDVAERGWLRITLRQPAPNLRAVGATVIVSAARRVTARVVTAGSSYLSANSYRLHFGLGAADRPDWVAVRWPDGHQQTFTSLSGGDVTLQRSGDDCVPPGTCQGVGPGPCFPFDAPSLFPIGGCEALCGRIADCGWPDEPLREPMECLIRCVNGELDRATGACILDAACEAVAACDTVLGDDPFERAARRYSQP